MINKKTGTVTPGQWFRPEAEAKRKAKNEAIKASQAFQDACQKAGVEPTKRQASKFNNGKGAAFKA